MCVHVHWDSSNSNRGQFCNKMRFIDQQKIGEELSAVQSSGWSRLEKSSREK